MIRFLSPLFPFETNTIDLEDSDESRNGILCRFLSNRIKQGR